MTIPHSALQEITPGAIIELYELELNTAQHGTDDIYRFHAGTSLNLNDDVVWGGETYTRFPIQVEGFEYNGQGELPRPKFRISNILSTVTAILSTLPNGLGGAKVTRIRTLARFIDGVNFEGGTNPFGTPDQYAEFPKEIYYVDRKSAENRELVEFELAAIFDIAGVRAPKRQCLRNLCQWVYRSAECSYTGTNYFDADNNPTNDPNSDVCGKRLSSCKVRFVSDDPENPSVLPYGAFPGLGQFV
jgi:lambda family phage minor tail protein L